MSPLEELPNEILMRIVEPLGLREALRALPAVSRRVRSCVEACEWDELTIESRLDGGSAAGELRRWAERAGVRGARPRVAALTIDDPGLAEADAFGLVPPAIAAFSSLKRLSVRVGDPAPPFATPPCISFGTFPVPPRTLDVRHGFARAVVAAAEAASAAGLEELSIDFELHETCATPVIRGDHRAGFLEDLSRLPSLRRLEIAGYCAVSPELLGAIGAAAPGLAALGVRLAADRPEQEIWHTPPPDPFDHESIDDFATWAEEAGGPGGSGPPSPPPPPEGENEDEDEGGTPLPADGLPPWLPPPPEQLDAEEAAALVEAAEALAAALPRLQELTLAFRGTLAPGGLHALAARLPLRRLDLSFFRMARGCLAAIAEGHAHRPAGAPALESLALRWPPGVSSDAPEDVGHQLPALARLPLRSLTLGEVVLPPSALRPLCALRELQSVELHVRADESEDPGALPALLAAFPSLASAHLVLEEVPEQRTAVHLVLEALAAALPAAGALTLGISLRLAHLPSRRDALPPAAAAFLQAAADRLVSYERGGLWPVPPLADELAALGACRHLRRCRLTLHPAAKFSPQDLALFQALGPLSGSLEIVVATFHPQYGPPWRFTEEQEAAAVRLRDLLPHWRIATRVDEAYYPGVN
eukprot:tig00000402_g212.t1